MESWKKRIKKIMPDRMVYAISVLKDFPTYLKATRDTIQKAVIFSEDDLLYAYDYGVVDKKMFPTIDDLRKAITAFQVDGECVSIQKDEINYPISPSVLQEINAEYNGRNLLDVVGNMIHQYPEQRRYREQRCIDIYGKLI